MGEYTRTVSCRMTEEDRQLLDKRAEALELANSEAIRALLRLPISDPDELAAIDAGSRVVVIDAKTLLDKRAEALELANSEAIRALLRLPISDPDELAAIDAGSRVVVIDAKTMGRINRELIRWGRH